VRHYLTWLFFLLLSLPGRAQVYPVSGTAALIPPYSVYLSDYTSGTSERLMATIILNDVTRPELRVRLRIRIEGQNARLETKPEYIGSELILQGGVPLRLTGTDLIEYFDPSHLNFSGITRREFEKTGALPQGFYTFCIEVLEFNRGVKISNTICAPGWLLLNDPPLVNLPRNNEKLKPTVPQNVIFQWTPRHTGSPNSAFSTEYEIKLVEIWPATRNPNDAILTSPPILETTTRATTFIYGPAETPLELGRKYALRIRAKSIVGVEELDLFKNNGNSEVVTFTYGDACEVPLNVQAKAINPSKIQVSWQGQFNHTAYTLRYRQAGVPNAEWYTSSTFLDQADISSLKPATTYEYQVAGGCGVFESVFTPIATIKTREPVVGDYSCGLPPANFNLDPANLVASLQTGDIIQAGDFEVQLTKVTGSNGTFSGHGVIVVPFLNNVKVKAVFENIMVNQEKRMVSGYMNVTGAAIDLVPDEVMNMMDDLTESLDKIEAGLDQAQDVLNQIDDALTLVDKVIDEVKAYLPDDILQQINDARSEIAAAKDAMKNAATPEAEAAAETQLKAAKQKLKDGVGKAMEHYGKTLVDLLKLLKEIFKQLSEETKGLVDQLKSDKTTADKEFTDARAPILDARNQVSMGGDNPGEAGVVYAITGSDLTEPLSDDEINELKKDPRLNAYITKLERLAQIIALLEANTKIFEIIGATINDENILRKYSEILMKNISNESESFKQAIKEGKLNSQEVRDRVIRIMKDSLIQDYLNSTK
jgi:hypothetical protein